MTGLLIGLAVYIVSLGHWPAAVVIALGGVAAMRWLGWRMLLPSGAALLAAWWIALALPPAIPESAPAEQGWRLQVDSMPQLQPQGWSFEAEVMDGMAAGYRLLIYTSDVEPVVIGDRIYVYSTVTRRHEITDSYGQYLDGRDVSGQMHVGDFTIDRSGSGILSEINRVRQETIRKLVYAVPGDAGALLAGLVTGDDGQLSEGSNASFRNAGLSHLTAVSGANLGMLVAMVTAAGQLTGRRRLTLLVAGVMAAWTYAVFVGLSPPPLRAALLTTALAGGRLAGRPIDMLTLAFTTAALQLAMRPTDAYSISFHLSTAASIGLAAGLNRYPATERRLRLSDLVVVTVYAQIATLPLVAATFGSIPLLAVMANVVAVPLASFAFTLAMAGAVVLWVSASLGEALLIPASWAAEGILGVAHLYGQPWGVIEDVKLAPIWMAAGLCAAFLALLYAGGDLALARAQLRLERAKAGP
jgi:ComEC/Rec2-related protein